MNDAKSLLQSKTFWVNLGVFLVAVLGSPAVTGIIPATAMPYILALVAAVNIALRMVTTQPVVLPGKKDG